MKTDIPQKLKTHKLLSTILIGIGIVLLVFMITVEDEPGAIPLLLIVVGSVWFIYTRSGIRSTNHN